MLDTLYQLGRYLSQDSSRLEFDDIISVPPIDEKDQGKGLEYHVAELIFDLDTGTFRLNDQPRTYDPTDKLAKWSPYNLRCIKIQGGNNKSIYPTVDPRKSFEQLKKTFFGKPDKNNSPSKNAEITESIEKEFPDLINSPIYKASTSIFKMKNEFESEFSDWKKVSESLDWGIKSRVVMLFASVVSEELGCFEPVPVAHLDGFDSFIKQKFLQATLDNKDDSKLQLCYITGLESTDVGEISFNSRYSLNKMFVTTTKNFATGFVEKEFDKNYRGSRDAQIYLERASKYILENLKIQIAGIDHCILPQFRSGQAIDFEDQSKKIKNKSDLLFLMRPKGDFGILASEFRDIADGELYWITFLGFESDGNFFKTINLIKDISKTHFEAVFQILKQVDEEMDELFGNYWDTALTYTRDKEKIRAEFNFTTLFYSIPIRKEKDKRNAALALFKAILERRLVEKERIFQHFIELIQLHRFNRFGYNIQPTSKDYFDLAVRNAVLHYHAFFQFLKKIKLIDMEEKNSRNLRHIGREKSGYICFF